jgi:apolipoprotein N-acyltransferase
VSGFRLFSFMELAATWVASLRGARRAFFGVLLGAASMLAFAPVHAWPVLFLTLGALVWLLDGCHAHRESLSERLKCASLIGFWFGLGYFLAGLYWIAEAFLVEPWRHGWLLPFVMTALPGGMALFFAAASALAMLFWLPGAGRVFALAIALGLAEFARGHVLTGLPWNLISYGLLGTLPLMQLAALFGVYALSLLAVLLFAVRPPSSRRRAPLADARGRRLPSFSCLLEAAMLGRSQACRGRGGTAFALHRRPMSTRPTNGA